MGIRCYLAERLPRYFVSSRAEFGCGHEWESPTRLVEGEAHAQGGSIWDGYEWPAGDVCPTCHTPIDWDASKRSGSKSPLWRRSDTGEEAAMRELSPGAMYDAYWMPDWAPRGLDGRCLHVVLPNGLHWSVDGQASNCTREGEDHDCWCRHGEPPNVTVDKTPEPGRSTCAAGAGSIAMGDYHGFLRNGELVPA